MKHFENTVDKRFSTYKNKYFWIICTYFQNIIYIVRFKLYLAVLLKYSVENLVELSLEEIIDKTPSVENWISRTT